MKTAQTQKITQAQIDAWKLQHDSVFKIEVDKRVAYLRSPNRKEYEYAAMVGAKSGVKFNEYMLKTCWLGGDMEIQTKDSLFMGVAGKLAAIIDIKEATLEKL